MTDWIEWKGGECPIKSDKTRVQVKTKDGISGFVELYDLDWKHDNSSSDIISYRITEDHEPKMTQTREQITAQIEALQKQLDQLPVVLRKYWDGSTVSSVQYPCDTHYFDIEIINGVPHIHGVAMKELAK